MCYWKEEGVCGSLAVFADALLKISVFLLKAERFEQKKMSVLHWCQLFRKALGEEPVNFLKYLPKSEGVGKLSS